MSANIFNGSSWNPFKKVKLFNGGAWVDAKKALIWNGSEWVTFYGAPINETLPVLTWSYPEGISGGLGQTVSVSDGTWIGTVDSYKYQWQKGQFTQSGITWTDLSGKTTNSLYLSEDLNIVGYAIRCSVIAVGAQDSEPAYATIDYTVIPPQKLTSAFTQVIQNGTIRIIWSPSEGATGYAIQWQGPGIPLTYKTVDGKTNNYFDWDFGSPDVNALVGLTTLGVLVNPINNNNPFLQMSGTSYIQGQGLNANVSDLLPNKPSVTATVSVNVNGYDENAGKIVWVANNITQTYYGVYTDIYGSEFGPVYEGTTATTQNIANYSPGTLSGPWRVKVNGTARGFVGPWTSGDGYFTSEQLIPENPTVTLTPTSNVVAGTTLTANSGSWANNPSSVTVQIISASSQSFVPYNVVATGSGETSASTTYTCSSSDQAGQLYFMALTFASNTKGTSEEYYSSMIQCKSNDVAPSGGAVTINGTGEVGTTVSASVTTPFSGTNLSVSSTVKRYQNSSFVDVGSPYTVTSSDLNVSTGKGGTTAAVFYAFATATNSAGSSTIQSSNYVTANQTPQVTYYTGTSICNPFSGSYAQSPSVAGPYTGSSIPADTTTSSGNFTTKTVYRETSSAALTAAAQSACEYIPPSFPSFPSFPFFPFFPPSFKSPSFPSFPSFPTFPSFPGFGGCIDEDTMIQIVSENDTVSYKAAKEIAVGDQIWSMTWKELIDESMGAYTTATESITNSQRVKSSIVNILPKPVTKTMTINNTNALRFSLEEQIFVKDELGYRFKISANIEVGDVVFSVDHEGNISEVQVASTEIIQENRTVYKFDAEPTDTIIAGNIICHNLKL